MKLAIFASLALVLVSACDESGSADAASTGEGAMIDCALNGAGGVGRDCSMERLEQEGTSFVIVRHPDGAFRRFELGVPGRGLITADGAEQAEITDRGGYVEVRVASDRYHLPIAE